MLDPVTRRVKWHVLKYFNARAPRNHGVYVVLYHSISSSRSPGLSVFFSLFSPNRKRGLKSNPDEQPPWILVIPHLPR